MAPAPLTPPRFLSRLNPWRGLAGLPREVWILSAAAVVNKAGTMVLPFFVLYLTREAGLSAREVSLYVLLYGAGSLVAAPFAGRFSDRIGPIRIMRASLFLSGAILLVFPFVRGRAAIAAMTVALSVAAESFRPANLTIFGDLVRPELRKAGFALNRLAVNLGMSIGPAVGGFLATLSFRWLFLADGATAIAAGLILAASRFPPHRSSGHATPVEEGVADIAHGGAAHLDRRLLLFLAAFFPIVVVFFQHTSTMPLYLVQDLNLSAAAYGLLFTVNTLMIVFLEVPFNLATLHWSHRRTLVLGATLCAIGFGALGAAWGIASVIVTVVVWTVGEMLLFPGMANYLTDIAPERRRGEYMGLAQMMMGLAFTVGPWGGLQLMARLGGVALWVVVGATGLASAALLSRVVAPEPSSGS
ncbi:MAG: MFS transporter [Acidobacteriota bacterium]|nr:MFS transporter [Acidobacteriota bacterium]